LPPPETPHGGDETIHASPLPKRPENGWLAWLATIGYLSAEHSPDAALTIRFAPAQDGIRWSLACTWGQHQETVSDQPNLTAGLKALWQVVSASHSIFKSDEAAFRSPMYYRDDQWLDRRTLDMLDQLIALNNAAFKADWRIIILYQALDNPQMRVQARLVAKGSDIQSGGRGASLADACRSLVRNAAAHYAAVSRQQIERFFADAL
jgi:hypothetical protein